MTITEVRRNSLADAKAYYLERGKALRPDEYRILWRLQDDPAEFEAMSAKWKIGTRAATATELDERSVSRTLADYRRLRNLDL